MRSCVSFLPRQHLMIIHVFGEYRPALALEVIRAYRSDPQFDPGQNMLIDLCQCTGTRAAFRDMRHFAHSYVPLVQDATRQLCVIWAPKDVTFGMARMYQMLVEDRLPYRIEVVRDEGEALDLLGIDAPAFAILLR